MSEQSRYPPPHPLRTLNERLEAAIRAMDGEPLSDGWWRRLPAMRERVQVRSVAEVTE